MFTGCGTALVTPFQRDLSLDEETLRALIRRQIDAGFDLPADQAPERLFIERKIALEGSYQRGAASCEHGPPPNTISLNS